MSEVSHIIAQIESGDQQAAERLLPLVYDELRKLAAQRLAQERPGQTLEATALVHEAYLRLAGGKHFENCGHFFAAAAEAMRRILVENARRKASLKRGGGMLRRDISESELPAPDRANELLALDEALTKLAETDAQAAKLVSLRYFAGLTSAQAADALGISARTADRTWAYARSWLLKRLESS
jgi:RNA polymerase sigma factor (TIGR02999 family)